MTNADPSRLRELLDYDPETGILRWKTRRRRIQVGAEAGSNHGIYRQIMIDYRQYIYHRVVWAIHYGEWPKDIIDHIDGDPSNNRISNLRDVSQTINMWNQRKARPGNAAGLIGAHKKTGRKTYASTIIANGEIIRLGHFKSALDAHEAYKAAKLKYHGMKI